MRILALQKIANSFEPESDLVNKGLGGVLYVPGRVLGRAEDPVRASTQIFELALKLREGITRIGLAEMDLQTQFIAFAFEVANQLIPSGFQIKHGKPLSMGRRPARPLSCRFITGAKSTPLLGKMGGQGDPLYDSMFADWRRDALQGWDGGVGQVRYWERLEGGKATLEAQVECFDLTEGELLVVTLVWEDGGWSFQELGSRERSDFARGSLAPMLNSPLPAAGLRMLNRWASF